MFKRLSASSISSFKRSNNNVSFDWESTDVIFRNRNSANLFSVSLLYELLSSKSIVNFSISALKNPNFGSIFRYIAKHTVFKHFAAESLSETKDVALELNKWANVNVVLDNSTEEGITESAWNKNFKLKIELIEAASTLNSFHTTITATTSTTNVDNNNNNNNQGLSSSLVPLKVTALCSPLVLEKMTFLMNNIKGINTSDPHDSFWKDDPVDNFFRLVHHMDDNDDETTNSSHSRTITKLSKEDKDNFYEGLHRLRLLCRKAEEKGVIILLDAEQSNRQPAIELMAHSLWKEFDQLPTTTTTTATTSNSNNSNNSRNTPIIYNTYQMYLKRSPAILQRDMVLANNGNYRFAAKIVRGAYISSETERAKDEGKEIPLVANKEVCDLAYNAAVTTILNEIQSNNNNNNNKVSIFVATHNRESVHNAVKIMNQLQIDSHTSSVTFATILGMADHLSCYLGLSGYNACKLVPYGEFEDVLPWLLRRLEENSDAVNAGQQEKHLLWKEVRRRLGLSF